LNGNRLSGKEQGATPLLAENVKVERMSLPAYRTCTVVARANSYVLHIPKNIDEIVDAYPSIAKKLIITPAKRLKDTTKNLLVFAADETVFAAKKEG